MMRERMAEQIEANERMKNQVIELENHVVMPNHVGDKELKYVDGVRNGVLTKNEIKKDEMGMPKEHNKE
nr:hypothetical protein [Tanacetum cinerariifolium]